jgi:hypothetical protein
MVSVHHRMAGTVWRVSDEIVSAPARHTERGAMNGSGAFRP